MGWWNKEDLGCGWVGGGQWEGTGWRVRKECDGMGMQGGGEGENVRMIRQLIGAQRTSALRVIVYTCTCSINYSLFRYSSSLIAV